MIGPDREKFCGIITNSNKYLVGGNVYLSTLIFWKEGDEMSKKNYPLFAEGVVIRRPCSREGTLNSEVAYLWIQKSENEAVKFCHPKPGQFFMLRRKGSKLMLGRPISVFACDESCYGETRYGFMVQKKGEGTKELLELRGGEYVEILGPLGNGFTNPEPGSHVALVGGGVGVAPLIYFSNEIKKVGAKCDMYAGFKSKKLGFDYVGASISIENLIVILEEGTNCSRNGKIDAIFTADVLCEKKYDAVYACGPTPMLEYVKEVCKNAGVKCYVSLESYMACGVGACFGCTIATTNGNKRCCKDGPVFDAEEIDFTQFKKPPELKLGLEKEPCLGVKIAGVDFKNPVIAASGTFGYGTEYSDAIDISSLGGICSKGLTYKPKSGNKGTRIYEVPGGMMNSIGLENPGIKHFINNELPKMLELGSVVIANLSGASVEDYIEGAKLLDKTKVDMVELNISCPNIKSGGMMFGMTPAGVHQVVGEVRDVIKKPLIVKLTPNAPYLDLVASAVANAGADAVSLVNTFQAFAIDIDTGKPIFNNGYAGLSGPGIKPIALRMVHQVAKEIAKLPKDKQIPIIGIGGITTWKDAIEFIMAGATAIEVGMATFSNPRAMIEIIDGIRDYMRTKNFETIDQFRGITL